MLSDTANANRTDIRDLLHTGDMSTDELVEAAKRFRSAERTMIRRREELFGIIRATFAEPDNKLKKSDIARITGYTREHIARVLGSDETSD